MVALRRAGLMTWISFRVRSAYERSFGKRLLRCSINERQKQHLVSVRQDRNGRQHSPFRMETRSDLHRRNERAIQKLPDKGHFCTVSPITPVQIQHRTGAKSVLLSLVSVLADRNYLDDIMQSAHQRARGTQIQLTRLAVCSSRSQSIVRCLRK